MSQRESGDAPIVFNTISSYVIIIKLGRESNPMNKEKKKKRDKIPRLKKKKVLKIGGLWLDPTTFPSFDDEKKDPPPQ